MLVLVWGSVLGLELGLGLGLGIGLGIGLGLVVLLSRLRHEAGGITRWG